MDILLVEDEANIRSRFRKLLEETISGCKVIGEAEDGWQAMEWLKTNVADVIITDIRMKNMNGIEMMKRVKEQNPSIPIIIISGYSDFEFVREALRHEVTDYLLKPVDRVELAQVIYRLKRKRHEDRMESYDSEAMDTGNERQIIRKVKEIVAQRLSQDISLQYLADQVHLNHRYLSVLFKSETGQNLSDYVTQSRIEMAKSLLKTTQLKIQDVARMVGYPNAKHFMSVFKHFVGKTPTEYRDNET